MLTKIVLSPKTNSRNCSRRKHNRTPKAHVAAGVAVAVLREGVAVAVLREAADRVDQKVVVVLADVDLKVSLAAAGQ
jgi:hypothetical protein